VTRKPHVTLADVARVAGVSKTTASVALGGTGRVSEVTREHVLGTAERLGYRANTAARHLRRGRQGVVGLYLPDQVLSLSYYMDFAFGAAEQARADGYALTLLTSSQDAPSTLVHPVDGYITVDPLLGDHTVVELMQSRLPVITGERYLGHTPATVSIVESDHARGLREMLDHVTERGAAAPALIAPGDESSWARTLRATYRDWCGHRGVTQRLHDIAFNASPDAVRRAAHALLAEQPAPDAIISAPDGGAIGIVGAAGEAGRNVGTDLLVATCVDSVTMQLASPAITALDLGPRQFGQTCVRALVQTLRGEPPPLRTVHPIRLVPRASTAGMKRDD
jgi:DNA-binding LacI/PurR family transcriptional regulator